MAPQLFSAPFLLIDSRNKLPQVIKYYLNATELLKSLFLEFRALFRDMREFVTPIEWSAGIYQGARVEV